MTHRVAQAYGYDAFIYHFRPSREVYSSLPQFAATIAGDLEDLQPRDMIDIQSFIWVRGSDEYP